MELPATLLKAKPKRREQFVYGGKSYWINYMPVELMKQYQVHQFDF